MENKTMYSRKIYIGGRKHCLFNFFVAICAVACLTYTNVLLIHIDNITIFAISRIPIYPAIREY